MTNQTEYEVTATPDANGVQICIRPSGMTKLAAALTVASAISEDPEYLSSCLNATGLLNFRAVPHPDDTPDSQCTGALLDLCAMAAEGTTGDTEIDDAFLEGLRMGRALFGKDSETPHRVH
jgi:hypothetical protein